MPKDNNHGLPSQKELEKEIADYLSDKYGSKVKIVSTGVFPELAEDKTSGEPVRTGDKSVFDFDLKPEELVRYLDEYVIRQDNAKAVLATKICTHFNRIRYFAAQSNGDQGSIGQVKSNVLLIGPTGVGKTFLIKLIAQRIGVPFIKGDATKFSETGYVGGDVEDLVRDLVKEADGDVEKAQYGIIYVDEIDKIAASSNRIGQDVSRTGVQRALLKPMEETDVDMKVPHDPISQIEAMEYYRTHGKREKQTVNTKNILFIMSGAFNGLEEIIKRRTVPGNIGFEGKLTSKKPDSRIFSRVKSEDLIEYGFESEFVGRLPVLSVLDELTVDDLYQILTNPNCAVVVGKKQDFLAYDIRIFFEDSAFAEIARLADQEKTGARGLVSVMERLLLPFEKKLPSTEIRFLVITPEIVLNPEKELGKILNDPDLIVEHQQRCEELALDELDMLNDFIANTQKKYLQEQNISLSPTRLNLMAEECQRSHMDPHVVTSTFIEWIHHIRECARDASRRFDVRITFNEEAIDQILELQPRGKTMISTLCDEIFKVCEYGFRLISQKKGIHEVKITREGVVDPEKFINDLVEKKFKL
mgnify:CR=1 FL=1